MRKFKPVYIVSCMFVCVIIIFMMSAVFAVAKKISDKMNLPEKKTEIKIDWEELYPFRPELSNEEEKRETIFERAYNHVRDKCEEYSSKKLIGYYGIVESAKGYEEAVGWNMASVFDYNAVIKLHDGYLTTYIESRDVT